MCDLHQAQSSEKTRRIFNKVNRNAKPTSRGDNIITSEDDGYAIVTRRLLDTNAPLGLKAGKDLIVNWKSNTLAVNSPQLTTISALYETVKDILDHHGIRDFDEKHKVNRPAEDEVSAAYEYAEHWWKAVLNGMAPYQAALADVSKIPAMREQAQPYSLLFKPVGQIALFKGLILAVERGATVEDAVERAGLLDWCTEADHWRDIIAKPDGKIIARKEVYDLAAEIIAYLISPEALDFDPKEKLQKRFNESAGRTTTKHLIIVRNCRPRRTSRPRLRLRRSVISGERKMENDRLLELIRRIATLKRAPKTSKARFPASRAPYKPILLTVLRRLQQRRKPYADNVITFDECQRDFGTLYAGLFGTDSALGTEGCPSLLVPRQRIA